LGRLVAGRLSQRQPGASCPPRQSPSGWSSAACWRRRGLWRVQVRTCSTPGAREARTRRRRRSTSPAPPATNNSPQILLCQTREITERMSGSHSCDPVMTGDRHTLPGGRGITVVRE
jgi:hypothetical protein